MLLFYVLYGIDYILHLLFIQRHIFNGSLKLFITF